MKQVLSIVAVSLVLSLPGLSFAKIRSEDDIARMTLARKFSEPMDDDIDEDNVQDVEPQDFAEQVRAAMVAEKTNVQKATWPFHKAHAFHQQEPAEAPNGVTDAKDEQHEKQAKKAAKVAKEAAIVANRVAEHSVKITGHAKKALKHALGALHDARVETEGLKDHQKKSLKKAEAHLREATKKAEYGELKRYKGGTMEEKMASGELQKQKMQDDLDDAKKSKGRRTEREAMVEESKELRRRLKEKNADRKDLDKEFDKLDADLSKKNKGEKGASDDELKARLEKMREEVEKEEEKSLTKGLPKEKGEDDHPHQQYDTSKDGASKQGSEGGEGAEGGEPATPVEEKGIDIDTQMPYGDLEPFGREDTAQELTESSIKESDEMVDQLERAEVAEEKRAVFRALTRLRGAAITSYDGVARSQTGNIDEYNKIHKWRKTHPLHHLADEESDISKWAFPENADFLQKSP